MACEEHPHKTTTTKLNDDGFNSREGAREALVEELLKQVKKDRKANGVGCSQYEGCADEKHCRTFLVEWVNNVNIIDHALYDYDDDDDSVLHGYDWPARALDSNCRCVGKKKGKK
jgi:hypothetical protein